MRVIKVSNRRLGAVIGEKGSTKKLIEEKCNVKLDINSEGEIKIVGDESDEFFVESIITAINRGFSVWDALKLYDSDYLLYVYDLNEYTHTKNGLVRLRSRVIGKSGTVKKNIESATDTHIAVYGHTISIIGKYDSIDYAKKAIDMILAGAKHSTVEVFLSKARRQIFDSRISGDRN